jgi:hypothetical protein
VVIGVAIWAGTSLNGDDPAPASSPAAIAPGGPAVNPMGIPGTPQPPGPAPAGKVWSVEHGHWHDLPPGEVSPGAVSPGALPPGAASPGAPSDTGRGNPEGAEGSGGTTP